MYRKIHTKWHYVLKSQANQAHTGERNKDLMKLVEHPQLCGRGRNELPVSPNRFCIRMFTLSEQWLKARAGKRVLPSPAQPETQDSHTNITSQHMRKLQHRSLMPSPFKFCAQIALPKLRYQMTNYCIIPLTRTGIHSLKRIQETSQMREPRSGKNNNPRKHKKDVRVAEFIAGSEAYQNNDRKSSPNNVQKSCCYYCIELQKGQINHTLEHSQVSSYSSIWKFLVRTMLFSTSFSISPQCPFRGRSDSNGFLSNWQFFTHYES